MEHLCSTPSSVHEKVGYRLGPSHRTLLISSRPSSAHLSEKLTPMGSDFDKHGEEAQTQPLVENHDDAGEYVSVWGVSKEGR